MPYSGPAAAFGVIGIAEAAYFKMVNGQGGVNGRKINFISLDGAYSPPKTLEAARRLVEQDQVLALVGTLGTPTNVGILRYLTDAKVSEPVYSHWRIPLQRPQALSPHRSRWSARPHRAWVYGKYILAMKPNAKIAVLYQHEDYGRDYLEGLREGLGQRADAIVVATASYETSDPKMDSQIIALRASGADTILYVATPKFAAMAIRKVADLGWKPLQIVNFPAATVTTMKAAGASAATGAIVAFSIGVDPSDPRLSRMIQQSRPSMVS
jgi:branched-chain amino acid transport system substrate-binding protein